MKLHLLKTAHGKQYWRYNEDDSDDARSEDTVCSLTVIEEDVEAIGAAWEDGATLEEIEETYDIDN